jgi:hypothetical protein
LIPASGDRDRTISPYASCALVWRADASIASRATSRDDRDTPLFVGTGWCIHTTDLRF